MVFLNKLSRHSEWRKIAKKSRRKRIRQARARERDAKLLEEQQIIENSLSYQKWLQEQQIMEQKAKEEEEIQATLREVQWWRVEEEAQKQWRELQAKIALAREEKMRQNMKIKLEWEKEQQRLKEIQLAKEKELEEKRLEQEMREKELLDFLELGGDTPEHLKSTMETNPGKQECPFFKKVSACRFFDACSRNHVRPGVSNTLLISNFFTDMSLEIKENEHGSDSSLEFEKEDTYQKYREFFYDVVIEMEKCGKIRKFVTCCNHEAHLRGNVYVQYQSTRAALASYHKFNGRWYGGKQLNVEFCSMSSWNNAICGMSFRNKCPKGNACNFLHIFPNPKGLYMHTESDFRRRSRRGHLDNDDQSSTRRRNDFEDSDASERKDWRWSESPEHLPRIHRSEEELDRKSSERHHLTSSRRSTSRREKRISRRRSRSREADRKRAYSSRRKRRKPRRRSSSSDSSRSSASR